MAYSELSDEAFSQLYTISQLEMKSFDGVVLMLASRYFDVIYKESLNMNLFDDCFVARNTYDN